MPRDTVPRILAEVAGIPADEFDAGSHLALDLGLDSLDRMELVMALEDRLDLEIPDGAHERWETVGDVIDTVEAALS